MKLEFLSNEMIDELTFFHIWGFNCFDERKSL